MEVELLNKISKNKINVSITKQKKYGEEIMDRNKFLLSIIIPIYNAEKYISKCMESIIGQTNDEIEIILINDRFYR